jgi:CheY-like chemotaxis protein
MESGESIDRLRLTTRSNGSSRTASGKFEPARAAVACPPDYLFRGSLTKMQSATPSDSAAAGSVDTVLDEVRGRFVADFPLRCDEAVDLLDQAREGHGAAEARAALGSVAHRIAGLGGIIGFPRVSDIALQLETLVLLTGERDFDDGEAFALICALRAAFAEEVTGVTPTGPAHKLDVQRHAVLVAEDDDSQRVIISHYLEDAGFRVESLASGERVVEIVRATAPSVVLLDIELPVLDGYSICRELKADPALAPIPVMFLTTRTRLDDRLAGLTLGADEYLTKPVDLTELLLRVERASRRFTSRAGQAAMTAALSYQEFLPVCRKRLSSQSGCLVRIRVPAEQQDSIVTQVTAQIRRTDIVGIHDHRHLLVFFAELSGRAARGRIIEIISGLAGDGKAEVSSGIACSGSAGAKSIEMLLAEAEEALLHARHVGEAAFLHGDRGGEAVGRE